MITNSSTILEADSIIRQRRIELGIDPDGPPVPMRRLIKRAEVKARIRRGKDDKALINAVRFT